MGEGFDFAQFVLVILHIESLRKLCHPYAEKQLRQTDTCAILFTLMKGYPYVYG